MKGFTSYVQFKKYCKRHAHKIPVRIQFAGLGPQFVRLEQYPDSFQDSTIEALWEAERNPIASLKGQLITFFNLQTFTLEQEQL